MSQSTKLMLQSIILKAIFVKNNYHAKVEITTDELHLLLNYLLNNKYAKIIHVVKLEK